MKDINVIKALNKFRDIGFKVSDDDKYISLLKSDYRGKRSILIALKRKAVIFRSHDSTSTSVDLEELDLLFNLLVSLKWSFYEVRTC